MIKSTDMTGSLALDAQSLDSLRTQAKQDPSKALHGAAQQFEALFVQMMLKGMRDATPQDGPFDSNETRMYTSMLDQQLAQSMAKRGLGLAEVMERQLARGAMSGTKAPAADIPDAPAADAVSPPPAAAPPGAPRDFVNKLWPHALEASRTTGIPAHFIVAQAALESGWGKHQIRNADGSPSHNLFGIKAGRNWTGATRQVVTTEYVDGVPRKSVEKFRAYGSYAEGLQDYAKLIANNPRFASVIENGGDAAGFARSLQKSGYATDPMYAVKLTRVINSNVMRQSLIA